MEHCHRVRSRTNFQLAKEVRRPKRTAKGGQHNTEGGAQRSRATLENALDPRRDAVAGATTDH